MTKELLGFQIANANGVNIQGESADPSGYPSFRILSMEEAATVVRNNQGTDLLLMPIYQGDIEDPELPE